MDSYSKFFEVSKLNGLSSKAVINVLKQNFARYGIPNKLYSDNGSQYTSSEFAAFVKEYQFTHSTSSPRYPRSNGLAEKCLQTAKSLLKKAKKCGNDPYLALLELRNTPIEGLGSPSQLLMGRRTRTVLPVKPSLLTPDKLKIDVPSVLREKQKEQKKYYDRNTKQLEPLKPGDQVRIRTEKKTWEPAIVENKAPEPRSYTVKTDRGQMFRRTRQHLLKTNEQRSLEIPAEMNVDFDQQDQQLAPEADNKTTQETVQPPERVTSSGCVVKMPRRYEDYVMGIELE